MISYFIYTIISLGCSYLVYFLLLKKQKTFQFNRIFLLGSIILCLSAPVLEFELFKSVPSITEIPIETFTKTAATHQNTQDFNVDGIEVVSETNLKAWLYFYFAISMVFMLRFLKNLVHIFILTRKPYKRFGKLKLIKSFDSELASSFFNYLFINETYDLDNEDYLGLIKHESVHSNQLHSLDVIFMELIICMFWFNPFVWFYKKMMLQNHEYIADDQSVASGIDIENYSNTIINLGHKAYRMPLTSGFNFSIIKNRIIMLHKSETSVLNRTLKIISVLLLFAGIFAFSSYKDLNKPIVVVIDAGHGGEDFGQLSNNTKEKDVVLNISNILKSLSDDKLQIITTRSDDKSMSLQERIQFINKQKPDVVVSLHSNAHSDSNISGIEAYYYESENFERYSQSMKFSSKIASMLLAQGFDGAKISPANFKIIKDVESPAVLLEIGFMTNTKDYEILIDKKKQQEIAQTIYNAIISDL